MQQDEQNYSLKVFYDITERIGSNQNQKILLFVCMFLSFTVGSTTFSAPFILQQRTYFCPNLSKKQCNLYVCSLPADLRSKYQKYQVSSLATDHGNYQCQKREELMLLQSFIYVGGVVGVMFASIIMSLLSKKQLFIVSLVVSVLSLILTIFSFNLLVGCIGLYLNFASEMIQIELVHCLINQVVEQSQRGKYQTLVFLAQAVGTTLNGPLILWLKNWKLFLVIMNIIPNLVGLFFLCFFIQETIYDSLAYHTPLYAWGVVERVSQLNGTTETHKITLQQLQELKNTFISKSKQVEKQVQPLSLIDTCRYRSVRQKMLLMIGLGLFVQFSFDGPELLINQYAVSPYLVSFLLGLTEVLACIATYFFVQTIQRRKMMFLMAIVGIVASLLLAIFTDCRSVCTKGQKISQMVGLIIFRICMSSAYSTYILILYEYFPTQIRSIACQFIAGTGYMAEVMVPLVSKWLLVVLNTSIFSVFAFNCAIMLVITFFVVETLNNPAPDIIQELAQQKTKQNKVHDV